MPTLHLAQVNVARMLAPLDSPVMAGFVARLDEINALADAAPGFVWRLTGEGADATDLRPYDDDRVIVNMSVWQSVQALRDYAFGGPHLEVLRQRKAWFSHFGRPYTCMWFVPVGHQPSVAEAQARLDHLDKHGDSDHAFGFASPQARGGGGLVGSGL